MDTGRIYIAAHLVFRHRSSKPEHPECPISDTFPIDTAYSRGWSHRLGGLWTPRKRNIMYSKEFLENPVKYPIDLCLGGRVLSTLSKKCKVFSLCQERAPRFVMRTLEDSGSFPTRPTRSTSIEEEWTLFGRPYPPRVFYPFFDCNAICASRIRATRAHPDLVPLRPGNISSISSLETAP